MTLRSRHKEAIIKIIAAFHPEAKIYLFGSYARGQEKPGSDIDVAVGIGRRLALNEWQFLRNLTDALPTA
jgi:predicted nucleotidyltransferase